MKINPIFYFVFSLVLLLSCSDAEMPEDKDRFKNTIELSYPLEGDDVHYCCFAFEWKDSKEDQNYWLQISESSDFEDVVFDTLLTETSLDFPDILIPSNKYYWRVNPELAIDPLPISEFRIIDYADRLSGSYQALIDSYTWISSESIDTMHQTLLNISKGDENYSLSYDTPHTNERLNLPFVDERKDGFILFEINHSYPQDADYLKYFFDTDSIHIYSSSGGLGGGGHFNIKAIYE